MSDTKFTLLTVSSLDKIFPDEPFQPQTPCTGAAMFLNERFSFQAAYCLEGPQILHANVALSGSLKDEVVFRQTGLVPSELPIFPEADDFLLRTTPGLYPDPLSGKGAPHVDTRTMAWPVVYGSGRMYASGRKL
ncbi:MAG: hypothetical protein ACLVAW_16195 [Eisenbergiella massiliensis]